MRAGTRCPDYDERPDMDSIACEKIPQSGMKILRRQRNPVLKVPAS